MKGKFIVIVGPSAAGKTELVTALLKKIPHSARLITTTTRPRRPGEKDDYFFISREEFEKGIQKEEFFEYAKVYGNFYGASKVVLDTLRAQYKYIFAIIDVKGAQTLKVKIPDALVVFIHPGSIEDTHRRIRKVRRDIAQDELQKRLDTATYELSLAPRFDVIVENKDGHFDDAVTTIETIIKNL
jgi:guanylate kinase